MAEAKEATKKSITKESAEKPAKKSKKAEALEADEILKEKKEESKAAKKAGPKAERAQKETAEPEKVEATKVAKTRKLAPKARPRIERRSKKYQEAFKALEKDKVYELDEAVELLPKTSFVKFDPSVEVHINLNVDPKQADQNVRATVVLPNSSGKSQRVAVLAPAAKQKEAKDAGADVVGEDKLLEDIKKGKFDFEILVATPDKMADLGKYAKELGPKGLMPNPKSGTVTNDLAKTVKELKGGRIEFRTDQYGIIHQAVGKLSLKPTELRANIEALLKAVRQAKPEAVRGTYIEKVSLTTTMGPALRVKLPSAEV